MIANKISSGTRVGGRNRFLLVDNRQALREAAGLVGPISVTRTELVRDTFRQVGSRRFGAWSPRTEVECGSLGYAPISFFYIISSPTSPKSAGLMVPKEE